MDWPTSIPWSINLGLIQYLIYFVILLFATLFFLKFLPNRILLVGSIICGLVLVCAGAIWPAIVTILFFFSSVILGDFIFQIFRFGNTSSSIGIKCLLGAGTYSWLIGLLAHFPINFPGIYLLILLFLPIFYLRKSCEFGHNLWIILFKEYANTREENWLAILLVVLCGIYVSVALMPEVGWDALAMHIYIPAYLYHFHTWKFDVIKYAWAVMPAAADWMYAIGYMIGGESASRLINLTFIFILLGLMRELILWVGATNFAWLLASVLLMSTPLTFSEASTLHVEGVQTCFLFSGILAAFRVNYSESDSDKNLYIASAMLGFAITIKMTSLFMIFPIIIIMACRYRFWLPSISNKNLLLSFFIMFFIGIAPYLNSLIISGNPVFPFYNQIFKSPYYPFENFKDARWARGITWDLPYALTFKSNLYLEALPGAIGFQWLPLLVTSIFIPLINRNYKIISIIFIGCSFFSLVFYNASYLRYVYPSIVLMTIVLSIGAQNVYFNFGFLNKIYILFFVCITLLLNVLFLNASSWYRDFELRTIFDPIYRQKTVNKKVPERSAVELVNHLNTLGQPVALLSRPFGAGLEAEALYSNWYNNKFLGQLLNSESEQDILNVFLKNSIEFIILDKNWTGANELTKKQFDLAQAVTEEVGAFEHISVRKLKRNLRFQHQLLENPDFEKTEGWEFSAGARYNYKAGTVMVNESSPVKQVTSVKAGIQYLNIVRARCSSDSAIGRLQINWHDAQAKFISADIKTFPCSENWFEHSMVVTAPVNSTIGVVYTSSQNSAFMLYKSNALYE